MKKISSYILILIVFISFFGITEKIQAQVGGVCRYRAGIGTRRANDPVNPSKSYEDCIKYPNEYRWDGPIPTSTPPPAAATTADPKYTFLAPLPCEVGPKCPNGILETFDPKGDQLGNYLNLMLKLFIGLCAVLAVVMIVIGGMEYMTSELVSSKEHGKDRIQGALLGIILILGAYTLLYTINPNLLKTDIKITPATFEVGVQANSVYQKPVTAGNIARCTPVTSGPCATANLSTFGSKAEGMSKLCNIESGGNPASSSQTDVGADGKSFSFGLFQINLLANGVYVKDSSGNSCANLFTLTDGSPINGVNYIKTNSSGRIYYDAKLKSGMENKYNDCVAVLKDPAQNIAVAKILFNYRNGQRIAWGGDIPICASAFD